MSDVPHAYVPPETVSGTPLPQPVTDYLNGTNLLAKTQALRISTVDPKGWPHASLLSAGDMLAMPPGRIRFVVFAESTTTANLMRDGRITVTLALDGGMCELRMISRRLAHSLPDARLVAFEAELAEVRNHKAPYAELLSGITFKLYEPQAVLPRWQRQIDAMRRAA